MFLATVSSGTGTRPMYAWFFEEPAQSERAFLMEAAPTTCAKRSVPSEIPARRWQNSA